MSETCGNTRRDKILEFVISYFEEHGYCPSFREIEAGVGLKSLSSVHYHIKKMIREGILETDCKGTQPRTLRVPGYKFVKVDKESR